MATARFAKSQLYNPENMTVMFAAYVGEQTLACAISIEALHDHFEGDHQKPTETFTRNRAAIERIAERLIANQRFERDGSVLIRTADC
jgi:hypothetical protein